jgi:16S rRNA (adenine1518-N6/adenine1519-N6)-dimethyltransferase
MKHKPKLGQNFLVDDAARHAIADAVGDVSARTVIEIGPGHGAITSILAGRCRRLIAIEVDRALAAELRFQFREAPQVEVLEADVLGVDLPGLLAPAETADVVGNLPYYITSQILLKLFASGQGGGLERAVLMMQREVAERVAAIPGGREYGLLSATAQMNARVEMLFTLPPAAFSPPPEVYSTVLRLEFAPRFSELCVEAAEFDTFLRSCFAQKRKTLANNLRAAGYSAEELHGAWPGEIPLQARAESVALEPMAQLYRALGAVVKA